MNTTIRRGAILSLLLIVALLAHFTVVQGFREEEYAQDSRNSRTFMELKQVNRGQINAGGQVLAESYRDEATGFYQRVYPNMPYSFGPVIGYVSDQFGTSQLESTFNAELNGDGKGSNSRFTRTGLEQDRVGNTVELSLDPNLQAFAYEQLSNNNYDGAIVALRPSTGQVLAMASTPSFDPNSISAPATAAEAWGQLNNDPRQPLLNHAAQDQLPPGSIFKIITTVAGLRSGYTPDSPLTGDAQIILPGTNVPLTNFGGQACAGGGQVTLTTAFALSCNTAFVQMALNMGADPLRKAAADFGVGERYDLMELGVPNAAGSLGDIPGAAELGQSAIGQRDVTMTALQAAVMAGVVANEGKRMRPYVVNRVVTSDLRTVKETKPKQLAEALTPEEADTLTNLMFASERATWGYDGNGFASKTGTAEHAEGADPHVWYVAFDPAKDVAVGVVVKNGGHSGYWATGGQVSGSLGRAVLRAAPAAPADGESAQ
ncbi:penicillin-binding transpeptidase domain-containing protein [Corynebacterium imitans]|uniref:penicillin-binding transpeptidase domain-containing protein n=1 Tax=Corynebacterium TaxID=1716 RepID=UPI0008A3B222|nr:MULTISPECIES: penicillin-binding transpeptidase domain-containing protein [Corynebacterium]MDK8305363.1 penicillin-binding transpeptidase domain-containing protein [Corynebacterium imitans]MDK8636336.1 penicillin-binding transpeptidase domain-containing protein [Corynebacterium imitans]MDK8771534.1 penicillin-binding transpeptidase domain-containing protein [Corynebacterium imitans]OHF40364.1 penicillin-binding protein [Corynebacterium sp. HMSC074A01]